MEKSSFHNFDINSYFQASLDNHLMWMRDTGLLQKIESDRTREIAESQIPQVKGNQVLILLR